MNSVSMSDIDDIEKEILDELSFVCESMQQQRSLVVPRPQPHEQESRRHNDSHFPPISPFAISQDLFSYHMIFCE